MEPFSYDTVEYPSTALPDAHPGHIHAVGRMYGLATAPVETCRYLEAGCGDGTHLIACALTLPDATFVGVDLSSTAIERGKRLITELGLRNVSLYAADLTTWEPPTGSFDYAMAHGLYSWVPPVVQEALLALFARVLGSTGVAYVSYNAYPGCYTRRTLWEMMKHHTAGITEPAMRIDQAIQMAKFLKLGSPKKPDGGVPVIDRELDLVIEGRDRNVLYHDDLSDCNIPFYFHEFMTSAKAHGFRFLAEAEPQTMETRSFVPEVAGILNGLAVESVEKKEQYIDFLKLRRFRITLLAKDGTSPRIEPDPKQISSLAVSGNIRWDEKSVDLSPKMPMTFRSGKEALARTDHPLAKAALVALAEQWPGRLPFTELLSMAAKKLDLATVPPGDTDTLQSILTSVWSGGLIRLHGSCPKYQRFLTPRPVASPLARIQIRSGSLVTTLLHTSVNFEDAPSRRLLEVLDGEHDLSAIAEEVIATLPAEQRPSPASVRPQLEERLARLAKEGLLIG